MVKHWLIGFGCSTILCVIGVALFAFVTWQPIPPFGGWTVGGRASLVFALVYFGLWFSFVSGKRTRD